MLKLREPQVYLNIKVCHKHSKPVLSMLFTTVILQEVIISIMLEDNLS